MKVVLLHGVGISSSRDKLLEIKNKFDPNNVISFDGETDFKIIESSLITSSLFGDDQLIILENPDEDFVDYPLSPNPQTLILWFDHEIKNKSLIDWVKRQKGEILFFSEGKEITIFPFLDMLAEGSSKAFLEIKKLEKYDSQYFIIMVFYLLRNLVVTPKTVPHFVRDKLQRQRKNFDLKKLESLYKEILDLDFKLKSGLIEKSQAEFMLINNFID